MARCTAPWYAISHRALRRLASVCQTALWFQVLAASRVQRFFNVEPVLIRTSSAWPITLARQRDALDLRRAAGDDKAAIGYRVRD
jgi:hypothetical protein